MTKTEILNRIENSEKSTKEAIKVMEIGMRQMSDRNTQMLALSLNLISASIVETMSTLSLIMSEMMPEKAPEKAPEPKKGEHSDLCTKVNESCLCNTCANDRCNDCEACCVTKHGMESCTIRECSDYVKEDQ